jgi:hypothetical protein
MQAVSRFKFLWVLAGLMLGGCQEFAVYTIYNNTPWNLVVELADGERTWVPGEPLRIDAALQGRLHLLEDAGQRVPVLRLSRQEETVGVYPLGFSEYPIPGEYAARHGKAREYRFQLQQDWNLYLMRPEDDYPAPGKHLRLQPPGFPKGRVSAPADTHI